jgi:hypothetical protein
VKDGTNDYPAGTWVGFKVSSNNLLSGSVASKITISTYINGGSTPVESKVLVDNLIGINTSLLDGSGNALLGFKTTKAVDELKITYEALVGVLFTAQVYYAVIEKFCNNNHFDEPRPTGRREISFFGKDFSLRFTPVVRRVHIWRKPIFKDDLPSRPLIVVPAGNSLR